MKFLPGKARRLRDSRPRTWSERYLRVAEPTLLGMCIFVVAILVLRVRYERSVLRAEEATRSQDCFVLRNAIEQYTHDKGVAPKSIDDLVRSKYLLKVSGDSVGRDSVSASACGDGSEDYMDPVETIPGFKRLYSYSPRETGIRLRSEE